MHRQWRGNSTSAKTLRELASERMTILEAEHREILKPKKKDNKNK